MNVRKGRRPLPARLPGPGPEKEDATSSNPADAGWVAVRTCLP
jgi:hypothetical protein